MFLNLIYFTDPYFIEISSSFLKFFQRSFFHPRSYKIILNFHEFFFVRTVSFWRPQWLGTCELPIQAQHKIFLKEQVFILIDSCNYLYSFQKLIAGSFFINSNCYFLIRKDLVITPAYLLKLRFILCSFFAQRHLLFKSSQPFTEKELKTNFYLTLISFFSEFRLKLISTFTFRHDIIWKKRSFLYLQNFKNDLLLYRVGNDIFVT